MVRTTGTTRSRRELLRLAGATAAGGTIAALGSTAAADSHPFAVRQSDRCIPVEPISGEEPVEEFYDYTYPQDRYEGPPGSHGSTYSSMGTVDHQQAGSSLLMLYDGPDGLSLVVLHGAYEDPDNGSPASGERGPKQTVSFAFQGLPEDGEWVVRDDYYLEDGEQAETNWDRWEVDGDVQVVHWTFRERRTDGGAFRDLGDDVEVEIAPAFNEIAGLAEEHYQADIERWEVLSGDLEDPERSELRMDQVATLGPGPC